MARTLSTANVGRHDHAGLEAPEASGHASFFRGWSLLSRFDRLALVLLVAVPVVIEVPPSLLVRPLLNGDNLTQNYPLRVLSGELLRHGRLPLWDPYIWSGTPLLAGWNAGAVYPGTWLFAVLPGVAAWTIGLVAVSVVCGIGMHVFLRRLGHSTARVIARCLDLHLHRLHARPGQPLRPHCRDELRPVDVARRARARQLPRATPGKALGCAARCLRRARSARGRPPLGVESRHRRRYLLLGRVLASAAHRPAVASAAPQSPWRRRHSCRSGSPRPSGSPVSASCTSQNGRATPTPISPMGRCPGTT